MKLVLATEDIIRIYGRLYKFDLLKETLGVQLKKLAKEKDFSYEIWKYFFESIKSGDHLEKWILQGMIRQSKGNIEKGLKVYHLVFRFDEELEKQVRTDIVKNARLIKAKNYVYIHSPLESKLEEDIITGIILSLVSKEDKLEAYLETPNNSLVKEALLDAIKKDSALIENEGKMVRWWVYIFKKTREGDKIHRVASEEIKAICRSVGLKAIKWLITYLPRTELAVWAQKELSATK